MANPSTTLQASSTLIAFSFHARNLTLRIAGTRDSTLTSHGVLQARHLAAHLCTRAPPVTHIFASDLQRAFKTAEELRNASNDPELEIQSVPALRERDFGPWEGLKFGARVKGEDEVRMSGAETHAAMIVRVGGFVNMLETVGLQSSWDACVAVVAHGIILNILTQELMTRFPGGDVSLVGNRGPQWSHRSVSFRNTGYLEGSLCVLEDPAKPSLDVLGINCTEHLNGLRKTRGGIGSTKFDEKQKTLDGFFKPVAKNTKPCPSCLTRDHDDGKDVE